MRLLLTLMAMAALVVSIGCDNKPAEPAAPITTEPAGGADETKAPEAGDSSATSNTSETQTVSLNLPGMT